MTVTELPSATSAPRRTALLWWAVSVALLIILGLIVMITVSPKPESRTSNQERCVSAETQFGDLHSSDAKRDLAQMLVGSAENSSLYWEDQVAFLEYNIEKSDQWNRGYTGGIIGFTSKTASQLEVVERYTAAHSRNPLAPFVPALRAVNGTSSKEGLGEPYEKAWQEAAKDPAFLKAQRSVADEMYLDPALELAARDDLRAMGQFFYYDAYIQHGTSGVEAIRAEALQSAAPPSEGGDERQWLQAWLDARYAYMRKEVSESTGTRVSTAQQGLLDSDNLDLRPPLEWEIYSDHYRITVMPGCR